jgi:glutamine amidotransferase
VRSKGGFEIRPHLETFAAIARDCQEYQGHGWGCAWLDDTRWRLHHDVRPIWTDDHTRFGRTTLLVAHARSAFRDEGIAVENNMPFFDGERAFIFNGELRGVRLTQTGRIGAEKVFNFIKRFDRGDLLTALRRAVPIIERRTRYVRAMNLVLATRDTVYLASQFNETPEYFQVWTRRADGIDVICSEPYPGETGWQPVENGTIDTW